MIWKKYFSQVMVGLIISVLSGVCVFLITPFLSHKNGEEHLVYSANNTVEFGDDANQRSFFEVKVKNDGGKTAEHVVISSKICDNCIITDRNTDISIKDKRGLTDSSNNKNINVSIARILPSETITISLLIKGHISDESTEEPDVNVHSDATVGINDDSLDDDSLDDDQSAFHSILTSIVVILGIILYIFLPNFMPKSLSLKFMRMAGDVNSLAFIFLLQGMAAEANELLNYRAKMKGLGTIELSNLGLSEGLLGNTERALKIFDAVECLGVGGHSRAVLMFNRATFHLYLNEFEEAEQCLREAFSLSKQEIKIYCQLSIYIKNEVFKDQDLNRLVQK